LWLSATSDWQLNQRNHAEPNTVRSKGTLGFWKKFGSVFDVRVTLMKQGPLQCE
jgi:hypothetical protein